MSGARVSTGTRPARAALDGDDEPLMDAADVGRILGVHKATVHRMAAAGQLGFVPVGRKRKFRERHVRAYLDDHEIEAKPVQKPARRHR